MDSNCNSFNCSNNCENLQLHYIPLVRSGNYLFVVLDHTM